MSMYHCTTGKACLLIVIRRRASAHGIPIPHPKPTVKQIKEYICVAQYALGLSPTLLFRPQSGIRTYVAPHLKTTLFASLGTKPEAFSRLERELLRSVVALAFGHRNVDQVIADCNLKIKMAYRERLWETPWMKANVTFQLPAQYACLQEGVSTPRHPHRRTDQSNPAERYTSNRARKRKHPLKPTTPAASKRSRRIPATVDIDTHLCIVQTNEGQHNIPTTFNNPSHGGSDAESPCHSTDPQAYSDEEELGTHVRFNLI